DFVPYRKPRDQLRVSLLPLLLRPDQEEVEGREDDQHRQQEAERVCLWRRLCVCVADEKVHAFLSLSATPRVTCSPLLWHRAADVGTVRPVSRLGASVEITAGGIVGGVVPGGNK